MTENLVARASVWVAATRRALWEVLLRPETVCRIMPVVEVSSGWSLGRPFCWKFEAQGKIREVRGVVLRLEPDRLLEYEFVDPFGARADREEHRHVVAIELLDQAEGTRVSVVHDNNLTKAEHAHAEGGWRLALNNLKALSEGA
jgi:uncharacterized protein YndB with AHSA1/START domain